MSDYIYGVTKFGDGSLHFMSEKLLYGLIKKYNINFSIKNYFYNKDRNCKSYILHSNTKLNFESPKELYLKVKEIML